MLIKIIWILIGLNMLALLFFIGAYFVLSNGRNVDTMESGWTFILAGLGLVVILLAAIPLRISQSTLSIAFSGFFAFLPACIAVTVLVSKKITGLKKAPTFAVTYYKSKMQQSIASAIENNDTVLLSHLIKGQDLNIQGNRVWDWDGLNYLQFAIRLRSNPISFPFNDEANIAATRILLANGCNPTPALSEAVKRLPPDKVSLLLDAGANPNIAGFVNPNPLLFDVIGARKEDNDMAMLLVSKGANVNAKYDNDFTPVMFAAFTAGTSENWSDTWRLVRYFLEEANCDYNHVAKSGQSLQKIITNIRKEATENQVKMSPDFDAVVHWLKLHNVETELLMVKS